MPPSSSARRRGLARMLATQIGFSQRANCQLPNYNGNCARGTANVTLDMAIPIAPPGIGRAGDENDPSDTAVSAATATPPRRSGYRAGAEAGDGLNQPPGTPRDNAPVIARAAPARRHADRAPQSARPRSPAATRPGRTERRPHSRRPELPHPARRPAAPHQPPGAAVAAHPRATPWSTRPGSGLHRPGHTSIVPAEPAETTVRHPTTPHQRMHDWRHS